MKKVLFLFIMGVVFLFPCFSQNMLILGGEYNIYKPDFWSAGIGFNHRLLNEYIQNDFTLNFGRITAKHTQIIETVVENGGTENGEEENGEPEIIRTEIIDYPEKFIFYVRDNLYLALEGRGLGLRAGVFASFGIYGMPNFPTAYDMFFNGGGFLGISILPKSLFYVTMDVSPGYTLAFSINDGLVMNERGFSLSLGIGIRLNLDKL